MFLMFYDSSDSSLIFNASPHVTTRPRRENAEEKTTTVPRQHLSAACPKKNPTNLRRPRGPERNLNSWKIPDFRTPSHGKSWKCSGKFMENHGKFMEKSWKIRGSSWKIPSPHHG